jgi:Tetratricopeptide repeat
MIFSMDAKKLIHGKLYDYPSVEFTGKTIRQILEEVIGQSIVIIVGQGMEGTVHVCGDVEIERLCVEKGKKGVMSAWAILSLWQDSPIIDIVWPPIPTMIRDEKTSPVVATAFVAPPLHDSPPFEPLERKGPVRAKEAEPSLFDAPPDVPADVEPSGPSAEDLFQEGYRELNAGHLDKALDLLKKSVTLKPEFAKAWSALGNALEEATEDDAALTAYRQALKYDTAQWRPMFALGRILIRKRQMSEAIDRLEAAFKMSKKDEGVKILLAQAYTQAGKPEKAAELMAA